MNDERKLGLALLVTYLAVWIAVVAITPDSPYPRYPCDDVVVHEVTSNAESGPGSFQAAMDAVTDSTLDLIVFPPSDSIGPPMRHPTLVECHMFAEYSWFYEHPKIVHIDWEAMSFPQRKP